MIIDRKYPQRKMELLEYLEKIGLPNEMIDTGGPASALFLKNGIHTLWEAIHVVWQLRYERTTERGNYMQVLEERRGTCSGKHALIAVLAQELDIPLKLYMGIFFLTPENKPEISLLLDEYQLDAIPEAHVYLKYNGKALDITYPDSLTFTFDVHLEEEQEITPEQIGTYKVEKHQEFIRKWAKKTPFERVWEAREKWLQGVRN